MYFVFASVCVAPFEKITVRVFKKLHSTAKVCISQRDIKICYSENKQSSPISKY